MSGNHVLLLMYHSISAGPGPTCIAPDCFRDQLAVLADHGYVGISLADYLRRLARPATACVHPGASASHLPGRKLVVLTFDDGYADFATTAFPLLHARTWRATVFLPAGKVGGCSDWNAPGSQHPVAPLLTWREVRSLARLGIDIGSHGLSHRPLTQLAPAVAVAEVSESKRLIEAATGMPVRGFSAPYGSANRRIRAVIRRHYAASVGTEFRRARVDATRHDLPRIDMSYFRDLRRWSAFLRQRPLWHPLPVARAVRDTLHHWFQAVP